VQERGGIASEDLAVAAGAAQAHAEILGGVVGRERIDLDAVVQARVERAVATEGEPVAQLGEADEDEREQRAAVPLVLSKMCRWSSVSWCRRWASSRRKTGWTRSLARSSTSVETA
jgi:hypothetical protein